MKIKKTVIWYIVLLLIPVANAVPAEEFELFEDDTVGAAPTASWYTNYQFSGLGTVVSGGLDGSSQSFQIQETAAGFSGFEWTSSTYDTFVFTVTANGGSGTDGTQIRFCQTLNQLPTFPNCNTGRIVAFTITTTTTTFSEGGNCGGLISGTKGDEKIVRLEFDWIAQEYDCYVNDVFGITQPFVDSATGLGGFGIARTASEYAQIKMDTFLLGGNELPPADTAPPAGLSAEVSKGGSSSTTGFVTLIWPLSIDDTDQSTGDFEYQVFVNGTLNFTDTVDSEDGNGVRIASYSFTGSSGFGNRTFGVKAFDTSQVSASELSCTVTVDLDTLGDLDSCGTGATTGEPAEFDTGLISTLESVGIITVQSKMLFTLVAVGVSTVGMAGALRLVAPGRMKNYVILAIPVLLALLMIFMDFLTPWEFIVALVLGVFATLRMSVFQNTYHELRDRIRADRERVASGVDATPRMMQLAGRLFPNLSKRQQIDALRNELQDPDREDSLAATRFPFHPREESRRLFREELESDEEADPG